MSIRAFRKLPRHRRRELINTVDDPFIREVMRVVFLGPGKCTWASAARYFGCINSPDNLRMMVTRHIHRWPVSVH